MESCITLNVEYGITEYRIKFIPLFNAHNKSLLETKALQLVAAIDLCWQPALGLVIAV